MNSISAMRSIIILVRCCFALLALIGIVDRADAQRSALLNNFTAEFELTQYSINSFTGFPSEAFSRELPDGQGVITFEISSRLSKIVTGDDIINMVKEKLFTASGITIIPDELHLINPLRVEAFFTFSSAPYNQDFIYSDLTLEGFNNLERITTEMVLYQKYNNVLTIDFNDQTFDRISHTYLQPFKSIDAKSIAPNAEASLASSTLNKYELLTKETDHDRATFLRRNRFWIAGATIAIIGGTALIITSSATSPPPLLPPPPGRP